MNITEQEILQLIQGKESLTLEFKSDKKKLPDRDLIAAIVSLANTDGGTLRVLSVSMRDLTVS